MRKSLLSIVAIFVMAFAWADVPAVLLLGKMAMLFKDLGRYEVSFSISAEDYNAVGEYSVDGDNYYMRLFNTEVYSDGNVRYEVDNERREINIDMVNLESHNVLDNPTRCFDFVGDNYSSTLLQGGKESLIALRSKSIDGEIRVRVKTSEARPLAVSYLLGSEQIDVEIMSIKRVATPIKRFAQSNYKDYEVVDFR